MAEVEQKFGKEVAEIVDGVTKLDQVQFKSRKEAQAESFRKMMLAMVRDIRVIMVKLADRTHNMRTLASMPPEKRRAVARETLDIYAPIANRLGIHSIKLELEELGFRTLYPQRYRIIERELKRARGNQREFLPKIVKAVRKSLADAGVNGRVEAREKHLYSVYVKMRQQAPVAVAGRRHVRRPHHRRQRRRVLPHARPRARPVPADARAASRTTSRSRASTATSRCTPRCSARTACRSRCRSAPRTCTAWRSPASPRTGSTRPARTTARRSRLRAREWLQSVMDLHEGSAEELLESVKVDLFPDKVYVFTPKGDIMRLPRGASCVDFAYAVHTGVGQRCVAAKVDRRLVPLRTVLRNGQTRRDHHREGRAAESRLGELRRDGEGALRDPPVPASTLKSGEAAELGGRMLNQALEEFELSLKKLPAGRLDEVARSLALKDGQELLEKIGLGERLARLVARRLLPDDDMRPDAGDLAAARDRGHRGPRRQLRALLLPDSLRRDRRLPLERARRRDPPRQLLERRRLRQAAGQVDPRGLAEGPAAHLFSAGLMVEVTNRMGILAEVATRIAGEQSNISHVNVDSSQGDHSTILFEVQVRDRAHLARLIRAIRSMPDVMKVERSLA